MGKHLEKRGVWRNLQMTGVTPAALPQHPPPHPLKGPVTHPSLSEVRDSVRVEVTPTSPGSNQSPATSPHFPRLLPPRAFARGLAAGLGPGQEPGAEAPVASLLLVTGGAGGWRGSRTCRHERPVFPFNKPGGGTGDIRMGVGPTAEFPRGCRTKRAFPSRGSWSGRASGLLSGQLGRITCFSVRCVPVLFPVHKHLLVSGLIGKPLDRSPHTSLVSKSRAAGAPRGFGVDRDHPPETTPECLPWRSREARVRAPGVDGLTV